VFGGGLAAWLALRRPGGLAALGWAAALTAAGFCAAGLRAQAVAGPVLGWRYYGAVEGRVVAMDRSASDAVRITLADVRLERVPRHKLPRMVRISLHGDWDMRDVRAGARVMTTAHLAPPSGPVEPGGFDFRRHAWFQSIGAVGYTRVPVLLAEEGQGGGATMAIFRARMAASAHIRAALPGEVGGFAAAVTTGDRSGVSQETLDALRASNLAHLLAISGLHMGLLAGFVFAALRLGLALVPRAALRWPIKKIAAGGGLIAAAGYFALSGGNVATERAFIMVSVMLCAVLVDRRAISLRAVAVAALIVLALRPEALTGPGFQMSFAATTALVAVFGWVRDANLPRAPGWARPVIGVVLSSAIAGLATMPVGAAHFNALANYGLPANLVSVPVMGTLVIPAAVLAACLAPFGLETFALWLMGLGLGWILWVAEFAAGLGGAQRFVVAPHPAALPLICMGGLFVILWQGRARAAGLVAVLAGLALWQVAERPAVLVADTGVLVGVMTDGGRALSKPRGAGFAAQNWLENDGDGADQVGAAGRWPGASGDVMRVRMAGAEVLHVTGKRAAAELTRCSAGQIVISPVPLSLPGGCDVYDAKRLMRTGSLAIDRGRVITAAERSGRRMWSQ
jgi:competence protein ComEC